MIKNIKYHKANRVLYLDILRTLALLCLVIAHTKANPTLNAIRTFDVPLMVFISAISFCYSNSGKSGYWDYMKHRFIRIYKPVFFFLVVFFITSYTVALLLQFAGIDHNAKIIQNLEFGLDKIMGSFLLLNEPSIGYVWIMRVFLIVALLIPLMARYLITKNICINCCILISIYLLNALSFSSLTYIDNNLFRFIMQEYVVYSIGYSFIIYSGLICAHKTLKQYVVVLLTVLLLGLIEYLTAEYSSINPTNYKYPPHSLYIIYGSLVSISLWLLKPFFEFHHCPNIIVYTSKNSMWLYLWHIIPVYTIGHIGAIDNYWITRYLYVIITMYGLNYFFHYLCAKIPLLHKISN